MRIVVTRPRAQAAVLAARLRESGLDVVELPLIEIVPPADPRPVQQAWVALPGLAFVMFVSANAVRHFFALRPAAAPWPPQVLAGSTGPGTTAALRGAGVPHAAVIEPSGAEFDSEALWQRLRERDWSGCEVRIVRGEGGRDWLAERLRGAGAHVAFVAAYARRAPALDPAARAVLAEAVAQPRRHLWLFSSSQAVGHLAELAGGADWSSSRALASHPRIAQAARALGFGRVDAAAPTLPALAAQLASIESEAS